MELHLVLAGKRGIWQGGEKCLGRLPKGLVSIEETVSWNSE
jgi:hypothetical protein